jgi:hypothetical protein
LQNSIGCREGIVTHRWLCWWVISLGAKGNATWKLKDYWDKECKHDGQGTDFRYGRTGGRIFLDDRLHQQPHLFNDKRYDSIADR